MATDININGDIIHTKADTFLLTFTNVKEDGVLIDFTGWTAKFVIKTNIADTNSIISITESTGIDLSVTGKVVITIAASTMNIDAKNYRYGLEMTDAFSVVNTWFNNKQLTIKEDVA